MTEGLQEFCEVLFLLVVLAEIVSLILFNDKE